MTIQTIKTKEFGEVPIIGYVDSFTRKVYFYPEDRVKPVLSPKQAQKPSFSEKNTIKTQGQEPINTLSNTKRKNEKSEITINPLLKE